MFNTSDFIFTSETTPQVTTDLAGCVDQVNELIGIADAVNVTDSPNYKSRLNGTNLRYFCYHLKPTIPFCVIR
mgnify:CR=1 FL=1